MKSCFRSVLCCLVAMPFLTGAAPVQPVRRQTAPPSTPKNTLSNYDFPDPTIINVDNVWYAFASQSGFNNTHKHIRMAKSSDFLNWELIESDGLPVDALPNLPTWATDSGNTWAPMVFRNGNTFGMYAAFTTEGTHCIGVATSTSVTGPYEPAGNGQPLVCNTNNGGAIDPSSFLDTGNKRYILWKNDTNSIGSNGLNPTGQYTRIYIAPTNAAGTQLEGSGTELLQNNPNTDGAIIEGPTMIKQGSTYYLFFSSNYYSTPYYDLSYATSTSPYGPFTKSSSPLLVTGDYGLTAPGSCDIKRGSNGDLYMALAAWSPWASNAHPVRWLYTTVLNLDGNGGASV